MGWCVSRTERRYVIKNLVWTRTNLLHLSGHHPYIFAGILIVVIRVRCLLSKSQRTKVLRVPVLVLVAVMMYALGVQLATVSILGGDIGDDAQKMHRMMRLEESFSRSRDLFLETRSSIASSQKSFGLTEFKAWLSFDY